MRIVIAGASGFLGTHLADALVARGHTITRLVRREAASAEESTWDPHEGKLDQSVIDRADVVVNTAGSRLFGNPHSQKWQADLRASRVTTTRVLAEAVASSSRKPAFLAGNGSSWYGDHGATPVTEESESLGDALMTRVTRDWQAATDPAVEAGARVCILRTSPVMARGGDTMKLLEPLFKLFLGARLGDGRQYFPIISLADWVGAVTFLAEHDSVSGPVNLCCPRTPTNREFTDELARLLGRRALLFAPAPVLRVAAGPAAPELLRSMNLRPAALEKAGYEFRDQDVTAVLAAGLA
jgi:uncharacterized protein (TIGR01777 family)